MRIGAVSAGNHKALSKPAHKHKHSALVFGNANPAAFGMISKRVSYRNISIINKLIIITFKEAVKNYARYMSYKIVR